MAWGNRVLTTTNQFIAPKVVDTILNSNVFATRQIGAAKRWKGETMKFPVKYATNDLGVSFTGFETFSTQAVDTRVNLSYTPTFREQPVNLPLSELSVNDGDEKVIDLIAVEMESSAQDMADAIGTLFYGSNASNSLNFLGLGDLVDDGNTVATIGGLSRATYTTLASTVTASGGSISLDKMATLYSNVASGSQKPTIGLCNETVFNLIEKLFTPQERLMKDVSMIKRGLIGGGGYIGLYWKGFPIIADEKATAQTLFFLNEDYLDFYARPMAMTEPIKYKSQIQGNDYSSVLGLGFSQSGWIKSINSATITNHLYLGGNLLTTNPKRHGKLTGITTV